MWAQGCVCALFLLEINCFPIKHTQSSVNLLVLSPSTTRDVYYKAFLNIGGCVSSPAVFKSFSLREVTFYSPWQGSGRKVYETGSDTAKTLWIHLVSCDDIFFFHLCLSDWYTTYRPLMCHVDSLKVMSYMLARIRNKCNPAHQMQHLLNPSGFISCIHLLKSPQKSFWKGRHNLSQSSRPIRFVTTGCGSLLCAVVSN